MNVAGLRTALVTRLRTGWRASAVWVLAIAAMMVLTTSSITSLYDTPAKVHSYAAAVGSGDALTAINGRVAGLDSLGGVVANEFGFIASFALPLMGISLVARGTRREEDTGRLEALLAGRVGRTAPLAAALVVALAAVGVTALALAAALLLAGVDATGAVLYALSLAALASVFAGLAALAAQLVGHARGVYGAGLGVLVVSYLVRGAGDVANSPLSWLSPLGWAEETRAFGDARWWPLLVPLAVTVALAGAAAVLTGRRDLGSALLRRTSGSGTASRALASPLGLAVHVHRGALLGWGAAAVVVSATFGALARQAQDAVAGNPALATAFGGGGGSLADVFLGLMVLLLGLLCGGLVIQLVLAVRAEETAGRLEPALAGPDGRTRWLGAHVLVVLAGLALVGTVGALVLALTTAWSLGDASEVGRMLASAAAYLPVALVLAALALALFGLAPRWSALAWTALALTVVVALLGDALSVPDAVRALSPTDHVGYPPQRPAPAGGVVLLLLVALALAAGGFAGFRRRDVPR